MAKAITLILLYVAALWAIGSWAYRNNSPAPLAWGLPLVMAAWYTWRHRAEERLWRAGIFVPAVWPPVAVLILSGLAGRWRF
jgi:hypothetical protein